MKDMLHIVLSDLKWWAILFICSIIGPSLIILLGIIIGEIIYYIGYNVINITDKWFGGIIFLFFWGFISMLCTIIIWIRRYFCELNKMKKFYKESNAN
jgi:uncharacterized membrane protein